MSPTHPRGFKVSVKALSLRTYSGEGEFFGGYKWERIISWCRKTMEGTTVLIDGAKSKTYQVSDSDYYYRLLFGYTPVHTDSVVGELKLSEPTNVILPGSKNRDAFSYWSVS